MYEVKDDFPIEYDGILGVDFLRKQEATCDYKKKQLKVGQRILKLYPYRRMTLKPRSETIIQVATNKNTIGVIQAEETIPGIFIGNFLVEPQDFICTASILNTTDATVEMVMPQITLEEIRQYKAEKVNATQPEREVIPRSDKVLQLLRTQHLNAEEKRRSSKSAKTLATYCIWMENHYRTCTDIVLHQIATQAASSPVNVTIISPAGEA
ncbi:hypothetical protein RF55_20622 [Lasius niger]|uniref:Uncharacterized protein n=1 Tax=Lasius niger TaxID=67767 RepID=A0A0J7MRT2_LASNI|nr:hypothetical protein RF55_20622 [Lasius niger]